MGAIIRERVERLLLFKKTENLDTTERMFRRVVREINEDTSLLQTLLRSKTFRLEEVVKANLKYLRESDFIPYSEI